MDYRARSRTTGKSHGVMPTTYRYYFLLAAAVLMLSGGCSTWFTTRPPESYELEAHKYACRQDYANAEKYYDLSLQSTTRDYFSCRMASPSDQKLYSYETGSGRNKDTYTVYESKQRERESHNADCKTSRDWGQSNVYAERAYIRLQSGNLKGAREDAKQAIELRDRPFGHVVMAWLHYFDRDLAGVLRETEHVRRQDPVIARQEGLDDLADNLKSRKAVLLKPRHLPCDASAPVVVAVLARDVAAAELLLKKGAPVDTKVDLIKIEDPTLDYSGIEVPLIFAPAFNGDVAMLRMLLKQGADVHSRSSLREGRNIYYLTLIAYAATKGHAPVVRLLLERGANPNDANAGIYTPVFLATQAGHVDAVKVLLERGANKNTPVNGKTPLQVARSGLDNAPAQYKPVWQEMVRLLSR